ncbi:uncharacterized protein B4U80_13684 [Leptotrombidium deliense]|uniref:Fibronectin type-III domain-containing protein n=1 Tax=Leptotrombidium deliense TaxID=299467 RepID=A0A443SL86_9ACAR|nr:uncharacterized protein B4U80_13684 [Leptotrombidium deliense]
MNTDNVHRKFIFLVCVIACSLINVSAKFTQLAKVTEKQVIFNNLELLIPEKPQNVTIVTTFENKILLEWFASQEVSIYKQQGLGIQYEVNYKNIRMKKHSFKTLINANENIRFNLTNVIPCTEYELIIRCRYLSTNGIMSKWSNWTIKQHTITEPDNPYFAPQTSTNAFEIRGNSTFRNVKIYWTPVVREYRYCYSSFEYVINVESDGKFVKKINVDAERSSQLIKNMKANETYEFKIFSHNSIGFSKLFSTVIVQSEEKMPKSSEITSVSKVDHDYEVKWKSLDRDVVSNTLFWCILSQSDDCESVESLTINVTKNFANISESNSANYYKFGLATNTLHSSTGIKWFADNQQLMHTHKVYSIVFSVIGAVIVLVLLLVSYVIRKKLYAYIGKIRNIGIELPDGVKTIPGETFEPLKFALTFDDIKPVDRNRLKSSESQDSGVADCNEVKISFNKNTNKLTSVVHNNQQKSEKLNDIETKPYITLCEIENIAKRNENECVFDTQSNETIAMNEMRNQDSNENRQYIKFDQFFSAPDSSNSELSFSSLEDAEISSIINFPQFADENNYINKNCKHIIASKPSANSTTSHYIQVDQITSFFGNENVAQTNDITKKPYVTIEELEKRNEIKKRCSTRFKKT